MDYDGTWSLWDYNTYYRPQSKDIAAPFRPRYLPQSYMGPLGWWNSQGPPSSMATTVHSISTYQMSARLPMRLPMGFGNLRFNVEVDADNTSDYHNRPF